MIFPSPLVQGTLIQRYKRFLADIRLDNGNIVTAYCANPGSMLTLKAPGSEVWMSTISDHVPRKLRYDWQLIRVDDALVGINTSLPNHLVEEALEHKVIRELSSYSHWRREVKYGRNSRIDFLLTEPGLPPFYVEVKNVNHKEGSTALFPDCITLRGAKHLEELITMVEAGNRAAVLYIVQRQDCDAFGLAAHLDPHYAATAQKAKAAGVEFFCYNCEMTRTGIKILEPLPHNE